MKNSFPISRVLSPHPAHIKMKTTLKIRNRKKIQNLKAHNNKKANRKQEQILTKK